jgi:fluoroacetyl-CoA thioesterase
VRADLRAGLVHRRALRVDEGLTVPRVSPAFTQFADMPPVFATAYMVGFVEATCIDALAGYLDEHERTVGTHIDMSHTAATPVGMQVTAEVELISVEGRELRFRIECRDEREVIGRGTHRRVVIDAARFTARALAKGRFPPTDP